MSRALRMAADVDDMVRVISDQVRQLAKKYCDVTPFLSFACQITTAFIQSAVFLLFRKMCKFQNVVLLSLDMKLI